MTKVVIDKENEITKLKNMLETLTDEKDKQSVRFAINIISGFDEILSERPQGEWVSINTDCRGYTNQFECSNCKGYTYTSYFQKDCEYDYCPNCGADMRGDK